MTYYIKRGNAFTVTDEGSIDLRKVLPNDTFSVKFSPFQGYYLDKLDNLTVPSKLYGDINQRAERILHTYKDRRGSTGVLLSGEKGSGKTLLSKVLSIKGRELGYPTLLINNPYHDEAFNEFMQKIDQHVIVIFDEMEKVYKPEEQTSLLTLFDGVFPTKKLFIITCNDKYKVDTHIHNRPGRAFYNVEYVGTSPEFIKEYCQDVLRNKQYIPKICQIASLFRAFNFDLLSALVEEMNRYNEDPFKAIEMLNAKPEKDYGTYIAELFVGGVKMDYSVHCSIGGKSPLSERTFDFSYGIEAKKKDDDDEYLQSEFSIENLKSFSSDTGEIIFENKAGHRAVFNRQKAFKVGFDVLKEAY